VSFKTATVFDENALASGTLPRLPSERSVRAPIDTRFTCDGSLTRKRGGTRVEWPTDVAHRSTMVAAPVA